MLRTKTDQLLALKLGDLLSFGHGLRHGLAVQFGELGLIVEGLEMRWPAGLVEKDHAFGFGWKVERIDRAMRPGGRRAQHAWSHQRIQCHESEPRRATPQKGAPIDFFLQLHFNSSLSFRAD